jgi:LmbE family N-acetylglucosaminyl deacetylase
MQSLGRTLAPQDLGHSAVVFAPHPDDETLACGGTIIKKRRAGAKVKIVYMTDGRRSHVPLMAENTLAELRASEALLACRKLGINNDQVTFLGFRDARLSQELETAREKVLGILILTQPSQVFIPYRLESLEDHWATQRCVIGAFKDYKRKVAVYEYPVWFWNQWPWVEWPECCVRERISDAFRACRSSLRLLKDFRIRVGVGDVLQQKYDALSQYKSQMTRLVPHPRWLTLSDVSNGDWLKCFFRQDEFFCRYEYCRS